MTGKIRYVAKDFQFHTLAPKAAEAAECAGEQGKYWQMHGLLFGRQDDWTGMASSDAIATFKQYAGEAGVDQATFDACLDGGKYSERISTARQEAQEAGLQGTPSFFINGSPLAISALTFSEFQQQIDYYLAGGKTPTLEVAADAYNSKGLASAPVVISEFSDFQ